MGLTASAPLVSPPAKGIINPSTGKPVGANDKFFGDLNSELEPWTP
jgi:NADH-quinone oxidoreductase subunit B